jgi:hypothetical protein
MALEIRPTWDRSETVRLRLCEHRRELVVSADGERMQFVLREDGRDAGEAPLPAHVGEPSVKTLTCGSDVDDDLEAAVDHPLGVERHRLRVHLVGQPRVLHHLGVDAVAMRSRPEHDPGEHHRLASL